MSEIKNYRLGLYGTEHSKCNHPIILNFKGLSGNATLIDTFSSFISSLLHAVNGTCMGMVEYALLLILRTDYNCNLLMLSCPCCELFLNAFCCY